MIFITLSTKFFRSLILFSFALLVFSSLNAQSNCDIYCPNDFNRVTNTNGEYVVEDYYANGLVTLDECDPSAIVSQTPIPGTVVGLGEFEVEMTVSSLGETDDCDFDVNVIEMQGGDCDFDCPENQVGTTDANGDYIIPNYATNGALVVTGNCGNYTYEQDPVAGTIVTVGTYSISLSAENELGTSTISCGFNLEVSGTLSINTFTNKNFSVYPNPSASIINFSENVDSAIIISSNGKVLTKVTDVDNIDVNNLAKGTYFLKVAKNDTYLIKRVIVE